MKNDTQLLMFEKINTTLEENLAKWENIAAFRRAYDSFMKQFMKLKKLMQKPTVQLESMHRQKDKIQQQLVNSIMPVASTLEIYAADYNKKLVKKVKIDKDKILEAKDSRVIKKTAEIQKTSRKLLEKAQRNMQAKNTNKLSHILEYGLTEGMIEKLDDNFEKFRNESDSLKKIEKEDKKNRNKIKKILAKGNKILLNRLDKFMIIFEAKDQSFYKAYSEARKVKAEEKPKKTKNSTAKSKIEKLAKVKNSLNKKVKEPESIAEENTP